MAEMSVMQRAAVLNRSISEDKSSLVPTSNVGTYGGRTMTVFTPENKVSFPVATTGGSYSQELEDLRKLGKVTGFSAESASKNEKSPARGSALSVQRESAEPASAPIFAIKLQPVAAPRQSLLAKTALPKPPVPLPRTVFTGIEQQKAEAEIAKDTAIDSAVIAEEVTVPQEPEPLRVRKQKVKSNKAKSSKRFRAKKAESSPAQPQKTPARVMLAEEWDPIAAGKTATPPMRTTDQKVLAVAAMFAKAVNGVDTRLPIPKGEKIGSGSVSALKSLFENKSNRF